MTASKDRCHLALPDIDLSIALAQAARQHLEHGLFTHRPPIEQLLEQAKRERAEFTAALLRRFVAWLKSLFLPVRIKNSNSDGMVIETAEERG